MKVYVFNVYSSDFGWKPVYAATALEAEIDHGEYAKYAESPEHVSNITIVKFDSAPELCEHLNRVSDRIWNQDCVGNSTFNTPPEG